MTKELLVKKIQQVFPLSPKLHCSYHPQLSGMTEQANRQLKLKFEKLSEKLNLPWLKVLSLTPIALHSPLTRPQQPYEIITVRTVRILYSTWAIKYSNKVNSDISKYLKVINN